MTMSCTLATIAACFSLSGVYVDTGLDYQDVGVWRAERHDFYSNNGRVIETGTSWTQTNSAQNPYGRIGLGYQMDIDFGSSKVILTLSGFHQESIVSSDRGVNAVSLGARYFPFARQ
jgi:hypothetical protein